MASLLQSQNLYKLSAIVNAISVPGHTLMGFAVVHPFLSSVPANTEEKRIGHRGAQNAWNWLNAGLTIAALLNWQWARTGGPRTSEEKAILYTILVAGLINGYRYKQVGAYATLGCMWVAPIASAVAYLRG